MFSEPVSLTFVFGTIGVIFICVGIGIFLVNQRTRKLKESK